jgi:predicted dehydrogenase
MLAGALAPAASRRYRVALIGHTGRGNYGHDWDLAWTGFPNVEMAAVADPVEAGRSRAAARSHARKQYSDWREMLRTEKPDIVTIGPRTVDQRVEMVTAAAAAGAHILVEKPVAGSLADGDRIVEAARKAGVKIQVGHTARPMAVSVAVLRKLRDGEFGVLQEVRARGKEDKRAGGEDMMVLGTHCFDLMRFFAGDPESVTATILQNGRPVDKSMEREGTEPIGKIAGDDVAASFRFAGGVPGYFASRRNDVVQSYRFGVTLFCSKAVVYLPLWEAPSDPPLVMRGTSWAGGAWERIDYPAGSPRTRAYANSVMAADLMEAIETGREPVCSARDGLWTIEMVEGVYRAHYSGARVTFPLPRDRVRGA